MDLIKDSCFLLNDILIILLSNSLEIICIIIGRDEIHHGTIICDVADIDCHRKFILIKGNIAAVCPVGYGEVDVDGLYNRIFKYDGIICIVVALALGEGEFVGFAAEHRAVGKGYLQVKCKGSRRNNHAVASEGCVVVCNYIGA